jgi:hypothetical protein
LLLRQEPHHSFGELTREGRPIADGPKATRWKANHHTSRALMNVVKMFEDIERGR